MRRGEPSERGAWLDILAVAFALFEDADRRGFGWPPFHLGGGTVLMLRFQHRLSKDIDLFCHDAQWLPILSPRLNDQASRVATDYIEQANTVKLVMPTGDIDFIIAADLTQAPRRTETLLDRAVQVDSIAEILAKKIFYRSASLRPRDVYDLSTAIELAADEVRLALAAARPKLGTILRRLDELARLDNAELTSGIIPYDDRLTYADGMVAKVTSFIRKEVGDAR